MAESRWVQRRTEAAEQLKDGRAGLTHPELVAFNSGYSSGVQSGYQEGLLKERKYRDEEAYRLVLQAIGVGFLIGAGMVCGVIWLLWMLDAL